jgi:FMN phosphatase YigB (HAD superfamily)
MRLAFDLDGTLYDSLPAIFALSRRIILELGYPEIKLEEYVQKFQSKDWNLHYQNLGVRPEEVDKVINRFKEEFSNAEPPQLIPYARKAIFQAVTKLGTENVYFITNDPLPRVKRRFKRDDLEEFLTKTRNPFQGKAKEIYELATQQQSRPFVYIGDLVSDGEDCKAARERGAENVLFYGITHKYAMNTAANMESFVKENEDFARVLRSLRYVEEVWR